MHHLGCPLPGKSLVILDQPTLTAIDILVTEDGQAPERSLLPAVLLLVERRDRWIVDRGFCTFKFLFGITAQGLCFALRPHGTVVGRLLGQRKAKPGPKTPKFASTTEELLDEAVF